VAVASAGPYASLQLDPDRKPCQHPATQFFTGRMPFLPPNQQHQHQRTEGQPSDIKEQFSAVDKPMTETIMHYRCCNACMMDSMPMKGRQVVCLCSSRQHRDFYLHKLITSSLMCSQLGRLDKSPHMLQRDLQQC